MTVGQRGAIRGMLGQAVNVIRRRRPITNRTAPTTSRTAAPAATVPSPRLTPAVPEVFPGPPAATAEMRRRRADWAVINLGRNRPVAIGRRGHPRQWRLGVRVVAIVQVTVSFNESLKVAQLTAAATCAVRPDRRGWAPVAQQCPNGRIASAARQDVTIPHVGAPGRRHERMS